MTIHRYNAQAAGANNGTSWTDAFQTFGAAVNAANADGDIILVQYTSQENLAFDTTYTFLADIEVIAVDKDDGDAFTPMGTSGWIGSSSDNRSVTFSGSRMLIFRGITPRLAAASTDNITLGAGDGSHQEWHDCYIWNGNSGASNHIRLGAADANAYIRLVDCTFRFGNVSQTLVVGANVEVIGGSVATAGSAPTNLINFGATDPGGATISFEGFDARHVGSGNLVANSGGASGIAWFRRSQIHENTVPMATQTNKGASGATCWIFNSGNATREIEFFYGNGLGNVTISPSIYVNAGVSQRSWVITTTAQANERVPFVTPWIDVYNTGLSAITPYIEILRDGSASAYQDDEVWSNFSYLNSGVAEIVADRVAVLGTPVDQAAGAGAGEWAGASGTAWSGKVGPSAPIMPTDAGYIRGRVHFGVPSATLHVDPWIHGL